ncbi:MAG: MarR family transcriptional regulator [Gammaproteobacteria bacterium]
MDNIRNLGFLIKDVTRLWMRHFEQRAIQIGLTLTHARVLINLSRNEGATQTRLAELSDTDPMTLVRMLDRMEKDGWLERRPDPTDRRAYRLYLKPAADPVIAEIQRIGDKARGEALAGISAEDRTLLMNLIERIHGNLLALVPGANETARQTNGAATSNSRRAGRSTPITAARRRKTSP